MISIAVAFSWPGKEWGESSQSPWQECALYFLCLFAIVCIHGAVWHGRAHSNENKIRMQKQLNKWCANTKMQQTTHKKKKIYIYISNETKRHGTAEKGSFSMKAIGVGRMRDEAKVFFCVTFAPYNSFSIYIYAVWRVFVCTIIIIIVIITRVVDIVVHLYRWVLAALNAHDIPDSIQLMLLGMH